MKTWNILVKSIYLFLVLKQIPGYAEHQVGNGGDVVMCGQNRAIQLLDYYEAQQLRSDFSIDFGIDWQSVDSPLRLVEAALAPLQTWDPDRYVQYRTWLEEFSWEAGFTDIPMKDVPDSGYVFLDESCAQKPIQAALQWETPRSEEYRYWIRKSIWKVMPIEHQAGLILHEILYRDAIARGHPNSIFTRYLTASLSQHGLIRDAQHYQQVLHLTHFDSYVWVRKDGSYYRYFERDFQPSGRLETFCRQLGARAIIPSTDQLHKDLEGLLDSKIGDVIIPTNEAAVVPLPVWLYTKKSIGVFAITEYLETQIQTSNVPKSLPAFCLNLDKKVFGSRTDQFSKNS